MKINFEPTKHVATFDNNHIEISKVNLKNEPVFFIVTVNIYGGFGFYITNESEYLHKSKVSSYKNKAVQFQTFDDAVSAVNSFFSNNKDSDKTAIKSV